MVNRPANNAPIIKHDSATVWKAGKKTGASMRRQPVPTERHELQRTIRQAINALPLSSRRIVYLWYLDRLSCEAIARQLGLSTATVRTALQRARTLLRVMLAPYLAQDMDQHRR